jgi:Tfp pilus assembly protein PilO
MTMLALPALMQTEVIAPLPPMPPMMPWMFMSPPVMVLTALGFFAAVVLITYPLVRALARRIEGRSAPDPALAAEVEELRARVAELEQRQGTLHELEERIDFTERLLAQQREQARLPH